MQRFTYAPYDRRRYQPLALWRQANSEVPEPCEQWLSALPVTDRAQAFRAEGATRHRALHVR